MLNQQTCRLLALVISFTWRKASLRFNLRVKSTCCSSLVRNDLFMTNPFETQCCTKPNLYCTIRYMFSQEMEWLLVEKYKGEKKETFFSDVAKKKNIIFFYFFILLKKKGGFFEKKKKKRKKKIFFFGRRRQIRSL